MAASARRQRAPGALRECPGPPRARRRLGLARQGARAPPRPGVRRRRAGPGAEHLLRRRADPRLARPGARRRSRPAPARRAHQPPRHHLARVARGLPHRPRRRRRSSSPTTAGSSRRSGTCVLELEAGRARFFPGPWHAWRRELAAREIALGQGDREAGARDRPHGALRRALPLQGDQGAPGPVAREGAGQDRADRARPAGHALARLQLRLGRAHRPRGARARGRPPRGCPAARCSRTASCGSSAASTFAGRPQRRRQDHADRGARWPPPARRRPAQDRATTSTSATSPSTPRSSGSTGTALEAAQRATGLTPGKARALLGQFLFSGEDAEKPLEGLSGGERRRLSLAVLVASEANVLILDEPTNHLDLDAREALEDALLAFEGALLLVSHDRALLDAVGSRTVAFEDGAPAQLRGRLGRVRAVREERQEAPAKPQGRETARSQRARRGRPLQERGQARARARARGGARRGLARRDRGRAGRPGDVEQPDQARARDEAPRRREARGRGGLRRLGRCQPGARAPDPR